MNESLERVVWIIVSAVLGAVFGGAGFIGIMANYLKRYIDEKLDNEKATSEKCRSFKTRRAIIGKDKQHAQGRVFFQIYTAIAKHHPDDIDNLKADFTKLQEVEAREEELNQEIILDFEQKQK